MHHQFIPGSAEYDDEVARRVAAYLAIEGKHDLRNQANIEEAITEARPEFWRALTIVQDSPQAIGDLVRGRIKSYLTKRAEDEVADELDDERQRAQNPELVNRDE